MAVTDVQLPAGMLAMLKRTLGDDMHSLKYVTFVLPHPSSVASDTESVFGIMDIAKQYSLNHVEFSAACRLFISQTNKFSPIVTPKAEKNITPKKSPPILPYPKPGLVLFRRDSRRKGSCRIISVTNDISTVCWAHNGKHTKISTKNLRNHRLFSLSRLF